MITEKMSFARSMALTFSETNSSTTIKQDINPNFCIQRKGVKQIETAQKIFYTIIVKDPDPNIGVRMQQKLLFCICNTTFHIPE